MKRAWLARAVRCRWAPWSSGRTARSWLAPGMRSKRAPTQVRMPSCWLCAQPPRCGANRACQTVTWWFHSSPAQCAHKRSACSASGAWCSALMTRKAGGSNTERASSTRRHAIMVPRSSVASVRRKPPPCCEISSPRAGDLHRTRQLVAKASDQIAMALFECGNLRPSQEAGPF